MLKFSSIPIWLTYWKNIFHLMQQIIILLTKPTVNFLFYTLDFMLLQKEMYLIFDRQRK